MLVKDVIDKHDISELDLNRALLFSDPKSKKEFFINAFLNGSKRNKKVLYIHTPFCLQKCSYCTCGSKSTYCSDEINRFYEKTIPTHIIEYQEIFKMINFDQVYFGGGTPTIANAKVLRNVFEQIPGFINIPNKCIEASPHTLTTDHIALFKDYNFSFLSIGIQSLDKAVCAKHNRLHISHQELKNLSSYLRQMGIYFNYDIIAFLDKGDIRDLKGFENELSFILDTRPSCVTIHQYYQSLFSTEKTKFLISLLRRLLESHKDYICPNSMLDLEDAEDDVYYQAEYRLVSENYNYYHYMWNKYASIPVQGYNILSIGYTNEFATVSNADNICYIPAKDKLSFIKYDPYIYSKFWEIRANKGLDIN